MPKDDFAMSTDREFVRLLSRFRSGNCAATTEVFSHFAARLKGLVIRRLDRRVRPKVDPEDVIQTVYQEFYRRYSDGEFRIESWDQLWAVFSIIAVRRCAWESRRYRTARRDVRRELPDVAPDSSVPGWLETLVTRQDAPDRALQLSEAIDGALNNLNSVDRKVVYLAMHGRTVPEIAQCVERTPRTVYRVLNRLRKLLIGSSLESAPTA